MTTKHIRKCDFCGKKNKDNGEMTGDSWQSYIQIMNGSRCLEVIDICPNCRRKHYIYDLYGTTMTIRDMQKVYKK
jgi:hypothetical protein